VTREVFTDYILELKTAAFYNSGRSEVSDCSRCNDRSVLQADAGKNLPCSRKGFATPDVNTKSLFVETDQPGVRANVLM
jgi:hypothetical protein